MALPRRLMFEAPRLIVEPRLGHILAPDCGEADALGFRNAAVPERADVIFVGDSQTYGFALRRSESLPATFATLTGRPAYGMALGGYGPVQYRELLHRALRLHLDAFVVVLYFGNDLVDAHRFAGLKGAEDLRDPGRTYPQRPTDAEYETDVVPNLAVGATEALTRTSCLANWLAFRTKALLKTAPAFTAIYGQERDAPAFAGGAIATLFTPHYREAAVDGRDAAVRDGLRITLRCLDDIAVRCRAAGVRPVLVPLLTKETVYRDLLVARGEDTRALDALAAAESSVRDTVVAAASTAGWRIADPTAAFLTALGAGRPMWPRIADGHLAAGGVAVLAGVVRDALR